MDGGGSPRWAREEEMAGPLSGVRLVDAPILLLVSFHKALRAEFAELHRLTLSSWEIGSPRRDLIVELLRRYRFLELVYKYHCAAEDEVIFRALDLRVRNVVNTYSFEHRSLDNLFDSVFHCLNTLLEGDGTPSSSFQELLFCSGTIRTSICLHMLKEEEQVFPLLMQWFSSKEQASLVWQFISSVPIVFLEDFLPWMISHPSLNEQEDVVLCIGEIIPKEKLLQQVVASWLGKKNQLFGTSAAEKTEKGALFFDRLLKLEELAKVDSTKSILYIENWHRKASDVFQDDVKQHPVDSLCLWHDAIRNDLEEILAELLETRISKNYSTLVSISGQLKFLADVLIFYSNALERVFFPVLNKLLDSPLSFSHQRFPDESQIEDLLGLLQSFNARDETSLPKLVEKLCWQLESFLLEIRKHLTFQETEVFPITRENCNHEMQQWMLYTSLRMMPLGLLKCVITWLSSHLTGDELKAVLHNIKLAGSPADKTFVSLLHEWVRIGYSGKTSVEIFQEELQEMLKNRSSFLSKKIEVTRLTSSYLDMLACKKSHPGQIIKASSSDKTAISAYLNSQTSDEKYSMSYSTGLNLQIFFPRALNKLFSRCKFPAELSGAGSSLNHEPKPIEHIFLFHKALKNDLEYLVSGSAKIIENIGFLVEFRQRFHLVKFLHQIHSAAEDEIAFPALEAKQALENISHSYTIDHRLEEENFNNISIILDEIFEFHFSLPSAMPNAVDVSLLDQRMVKYHQLCMKLHEHFSIEEQLKIVGCMLGMTRAESLQEMIPWLMASLTPEEQHAMMSLWHNATKNTMFSDWLGEWWEGVNRYGIANVVEESNNSPSGTEDPLEVIATYLSKEFFDEPNGGNHHGEGLKVPQEDPGAANFEPSGTDKGGDKRKFQKGDLDEHQFPEGIKLCREDRKQQYNVACQSEKSNHILQVDEKFKHQEENILTITQEGLEAAIRRVSCDPGLNPEKKSYIIQNLIMSRWIVRKQKSHPQALPSTREEVTGQSPSYRDTLGETFGCEHYKRNCKLFAACCNQLFTCRYCHDDVADHSMDRKSTTKMMCMKCLKIQPIGPTCSNISCNGLSMARYFCRICKLFDDEREIYHCPYCNLCRVGKGLGIDYFHCMNCNACMSKSLAVHICREKCFESNCPICNEYIFTSSSPVKALPCGHLMHSTCFQDYTRTHYICPICSKSLGDMQVYFGMLDALLAEEKIPEEYSAQTQVILCNDCEKRGVAPFHWLYHKCSHCGSYNTRLL
ncbi:PREDICTED: uncharacterized protein LOC104608041 isoform X2 [Nelumbo nucifera]|uniref:Uncharacterized protein LOC104608041 isoform X2 n=1 Tax=Nelumbo nucifera TaxID=4432 RepID=A0A1U8B7G5_NELNU|nr:PREDICTED: uncharacterized protein LOC104608041 isoform X2 [Nelumbo nucifera]